MYINQWGVYLDKETGRCIHGAADRVIHVELLTRPSGSAKTKMMKELLRIGRYCTYLEAGFWTVVRDSVELNRFRWWFQPCWRRKLC
jgi:hypothetical protein